MNTIDQRNDEREERIIRALGYLKAVLPSDEFALRARRAILSYPQYARTPLVLRLMPRRILWTAAAGIAAFLVMLTAYLAVPRSQLALESEKLMREANEIEFSVKLSEAKYFEESAEVVSLALERLAASDRE